MCWGEEQKPSVWSFACIAVCLGIETTGINTIRTIVNHHGSTIIQHIIRAGIIKGNGVAIGTCYSIAIISRRPCAFAQ